MQITPVTPHRHRFSTNVARTERVCSLCGVRQVKRSGRWQITTQEVTPS